MERWLCWALGAISVGFVLLFLYTAFARLRYPFSYDQVEGGVVTSVWRIAHGLPLYTRPTLDFVPFLYAPVYLYLAAALSKLTGAGYVSIRLLSILGTVGSMGVIYAIIHGETKNAQASLAGVGLFAACYGPLQGWFDIGRVDSLFLFFMLLAIYCTRHAPILLAVLVWLIAFQTKQTILPVAVLILCADWQRPRRLITGLVTLLAGAAGSVLLMNHLTGGWYSFYLFGTARGLSWVARAAVFYIPLDLLLPLGLGFLIVLASLLYVPPALRSTSVRFYVVVSIAVYGSIGYLRSHHGSAVNTLMPAYAWTAVLFGLALFRLRSWLSRVASSQAQIGQVLLLGAATVQLLVFVYNPGKYVLPVEYRNTRWTFEKQLRALPGDIYVINHSYDAMLAGKRPHAVIDAFGIIQDSPSSPLRDSYMADFWRAIDTHAYSGFVLDDAAETYNPGKGWMPADFLQQYPVRILADGADAASVISQPQEKWIYLTCASLDQDLSQVIHATSAVSYGDCPNAPASGKR